jgi:hypothetical protein
MQGNKKVGRLWKASSVVIPSIPGNYLRGLITDGEEWQITLSGRFVPRKMLISTEGRFITPNLSNYRVCRWNEKGREADLTVYPRTKVIRPFIVVQRVSCAVSWFRIPSHVADNRISALGRATTARKHNEMWFTNHVQLIFMTRHGLGHVIV